MNDSITTPTISYVDGALPAIVQEAEEYLIASEVPVYQRDGKIVRIGRFPIHDGHPSLSFVELTKDALVELFTTIIQWRKFDGRKGEEKVVNCPDRVAMTYQSRSGKWRLPVIRSIITTPTLRRDGSLLEEPGYDRVTGLYFDPQGIRFPSIPVAPAKDDAHQALKYILGFVSEVPFVVDDDYGDISRSVFLSGLLSALVRPILPAVPLHGFNAPAAGSGKSILVNAITSVVTGSPASPISQGLEEEMVKTLSSALQAGYRVISFDNCEHPLGGAVLCQAVSEPELSLRVFGKTELKQIANTAMYFATGNNLMFTGDMVRRALRCTIDAGCERPEERKFKTVRPDIAMGNNRVEIVMAGLTLLRAFFHAGCPKQSDPAGNFERWSATIRDCLIWLGEADPWLTTVGVRKEDPEIENNIAALTAWHDTFESRKMTTKDVIEGANARAEPAQGAPGRLVNATLRDALQVVAGGRLDSQNLGTWLRGIKGRPIGGYVVAQAGMSAGNNRWQVTAAGVKPETNDSRYKSIVEAMFR